MFTSRRLPNFSKMRHRLCSVVCDFEWFWNNPWSSDVSSVIETRAGIQQMMNSRLRLQLALGLLLLHLLERQPRELFVRDDSLVLDYLFVNINDGPGPPYVTCFHEPLLTVPAYD